MKPIRVGMIRLDTHAMYFAPLMMKHDPMLLRDPLHGRNIKLHRGWQLGSCYFYFYTLYSNCRTMTAPRVGGFEITKVWDDRDLSVAENFSEVFYNRPQVCRTIDEACEDVDLVFISDVTGEGKDHLKLATPGLKKGVPTFIDKPFAYDVKQAKAILQLAKKHRAPVLSLSMLRVAPNVARFRRRLDEIAPVEFGTVKGYNEGLGGQIHTISLAQHVFGAGVEAVQCMGSTEMAHVLLDYGGKPDRPKAGVMLNNESGGGWHSSMSVSAYSKQGIVHSEGINDFHFPWAAAEVLKQVRKMVRTGKPQAPYPEMLENVAVAEAARLSQKSRRRVALAEVMGKNRRNQSILHS